jgi:tetratricopeptide (TPR) repeat protein
LIPIRCPDAILGSEEERTEQAKLLQQQKVIVNNQIEILKIAKTLAYKHLFDADYELAIPAALQALKFSMDLHGNNPIELVPSYLILGESSVGMKQYNEAEEYLSLAKWAILKSENSDDAIKSKLHRNFGQLYAAQEQYEKALYQLAMDVYHCSKATSPEDVQVTGGYYLMGNIFVKQTRLEDAIAFYDKVVTIWTSKWTPKYTLDVAQAAEATQMLSSILKFRQQHNPTASIIKVNMFTLAKIYLSASQLESSREMANKALEGLSY